MTDKELFLKEVKEDELYGNDYMEIPFGSNSSAMIFDDKTVEFNSFNLERFFFQNVDDFANWRYEDNVSVKYKYQVYLGERESKNADEIESKYQIDEEEDGGMIWSIKKEITEKERDSVTFYK